MTMHPTPELRWIERTVKTRVEVYPGHFGTPMRDAEETYRVLQQLWRQDAGGSGQEWRDVPTARKGER